jgi:hypothetical protein
MDNPHTESDVAGDDRHAPLRRSIYWLLILIGMGAVLGRILAVDSVDRRGLPDAALKEKLDQARQALVGRGVKDRELADALEREKSRLLVSLGIRRPFLSANDRSRWCTVRALVEPAMRVPGAPYAIDRVIQQPGWDTIDMVKKTDTGHLYSSKPPLLPTLLAAEYWVIYRLTGMSLGEHPFEIGRFMLATVNGACLLLYFLAMARLVERLGASDWGRLFVMASAVFGTFLTTFAVVITNHLVAAAAAAVLLETGTRIWLDGDRRVRTFALAGFMAAFLAANELPAAALAALVSLALLCKAPRATLTAYLPPALLVTAAFFATNWIAVGSLKPAYMHRGGANNWYDYTYQRGGRTIESYWRHPAGIDRGEPSTPRYVMHALVGHHGILSLTPIWLLSVCGAVIWLVADRKRRPLERIPRKSGGENASGTVEIGRQERETSVRHALAILAALVTCVCLAFYLGWPGIDRNYGGMSSGFRWVFWMAPLWLIVMLPAADAAARRGWLRAVALVLLALSVLSASYPTWNPWTNPWLADFLNYVGS